MFLSQLKFLKINFVFELVHFLMEFLFYFLISDWILLMSCFLLMEENTFQVESKYPKHP